KDSTALLFILAYLRRFSHLRFELEAVILDLGWGEVDFRPHRDLCRRLEVPLHIRVHPVASIIRGKEGMSACTLCGKLRAGILNSIALERGANRVALGHHLDDVIETYFLNLIFAGRMKTFMPSTYLSNTGLTLIRPLVYLPEKVTAGLVETEKLPVIENPCPHNGYTKRDEMKEIVSGLSHRYPKFRERFLSGLENISLQNLWNQRQTAPEQSAAGDKALLEPENANSDMAGEKTRPGEGGE
ncbi:MAG: tRNA 2-thiocytidine biosynthesis protein TtcA, partial [Candidatus Desulforudis sp.]|nr:tRNA 2-thiocytidine biosynthesis protein TtcA [Desulforudis sp.]